MLNLKTIKPALEQMEEERNIPQEKIIDAIEDSLTAAYKRDYGKKGQIIRCKLNMETGETEFSQVKIVVDETLVRMTDEKTDENDERPKFNEDHHILISDAQKIKKNIELNEEIVFPLEVKEDFGRIAAQTAKQVIIQRIREAEKVSILEEYSEKEGEIVSGKVQKVERGNVYIDLGRTTAFLPYEEQIAGEYYRQGERIKAYLYLVEENNRGVNIKLSRSHPKFAAKLFALETPEIANGTVEIKSVAREAGSRTKMAVFSNDPGIDPVGSCVGQKGSRVNTVITELGGEKIDIIEWSESLVDFITQALSPAKIHKVTLDEDTNEAKVEVPEDQFSLAVGKGGKNVRLAAKLTDWKIDIVTPEGETADPEASADPEEDAGSIAAIKAELESQELKTEEKSIDQAPETKETPETEELDEFEDIE